MLALGAALVLARGTGDGGPAQSSQALAVGADPVAPESATPDPDAGRPVEECRLKVIKAVVDIDPDLRDFFATKSAGIDATPPATLAENGRITLQPRVSVFVTCDLSSGVIGLRGGLKIKDLTAAVEDQHASVDLRRWRISAPSGRIEASLSGIAKTRSYALHTPLRRAKRVRKGSIETINMPVRIAEGGAAVINHTFGTELRNRKTKLGTLRLTVERIEQES